MEKAQVDNAAAVVDADLETAAFAELNAAVQHFALYQTFAACMDLSEGRYLGAVLVAQWQMQQQVDETKNPQFCQGGL